MNKREFDYILQSGESYLIEFKERVNSSLVREMIAFANASGGRIFLGVTDNGKARGIEITNKLRSRIQDMANNCQPSETAGLPAPHFEFGDFYTIIFYRKQYVSQTVEKTPEKTPGKTPLQILKIISDQPTLTIHELAKMIKKSDSATERAIRKLREANLVKRIGSAKGGYWQVISSE